ncbi:MAG TPA: phosphatase PAP2 family protein [Sporichthyaceae bacterium]|nr:phosphatase PAP2 family protein [Sporichthyaceae bacterium]
MLRGRGIEATRSVVLTIWGALLVWQILGRGVPFDREGLLLWIGTGLGAASLGRRSVGQLVIDFLPFALVLIAYDYLRGFSYRLGMPTWWYPQIKVDRWLCFGHEPSVWLQEHLKYPDVRWWDVAVYLCYTSFFLLPYLTAAVLWLRSRTDFYRWSARFVSLSFVGFVLFALIPAAPPWAASRCLPAEVAGHPSDPACMSGYGPTPPGGLLGVMQHPRDGALDRIQRISGRGADPLHLDTAATFWDKGKNTVDLVAAVPSLHLAGTVLFVLFLWRRVHRGWWPVLALYPLAMTFSLVYSGEHYLSDCLAGALIAFVVAAVANRVEARMAISRLPAARLATDLDQIPQPVAAVT